MYRYELHLHTMETSRCGHVRAADQVRTYHRLGYQGLCVTDHLHDTYLSLMDCHDDWNECVRRYLYGYHLAKEEGERLGMDIIFGVELRFPENESDYLIYGIDEDWLYRNPFVCRMDHRSFFEKYGNEVLIIHAHPFRNNDTVYYDCVHGLEVVNCNPRHDSRNHLALELAKQNPHLYRTVGSDAHRIGDEGRSALLSEVRIPDSYAMARVITSGNYGLWCPEYDNILKECEAIPHV
ncbi:MAG: PHP domain-containing protein [Lachnospiraceae bacterium]|nr:PHP domain-containing protein [Lachnospiraceae bacterium]